MHRGEEIKVEELSLMIISPFGHKTMAACCYSYYCVCEKRTFYLKLHLEKIKALPSGWVLSQSSGSSMQMHVITTFSKAQCKLCNPHNFSPLLLRCKIQYAEYFWILLTLNPWPHPMPIFSPLQSVQRLRDVQYGYGSFQWGQYGRNFQNFHLVRELGEERRRHSSNTRVANTVSTRQNCQLPLDTSENT